MAQKWYEMVQKGSEILQEGENVPKIWSKIAFKGSMAKNFQDIRRPKSSPRDVNRLKSS